MRERELHHCHRPERRCRFRSPSLARSCPGRRARAFADTHHTRVVGGRWWCRHPTTADKTEADHGDASARARGHGRPSCCYRLPHTPGRGDLLGRVPESRGWLSPVAVPESAQLRRGMADGKGMQLLYRGPGRHVDEDRTAVGVHRSGSSEVRHESGCVVRWRPRSSLVMEAA